MIPFDCPQCGFSKNVPDGFVGQKVICPKCRVKSVVSSLKSAVEAIDRSVASIVLPKDAEWFFASGETRGGFKTV